MVIKFLVIGFLKNADKKRRLWVIEYKIATPTFGRLAMTVEGEGACIDNTFPSSVTARSEAAKQSHTVMQEELKAY